MQLSPDRSPHKFGKTGSKRQRTVNIKNLTSSLCASNAITNRRLHSTPLSMADFEENSEEASEQESLSNNLYSYILLKYTVQHHNEFDCTLSEMRSFLKNKYLVIQCNRHVFTTWSSSMKT